MHWHRGEPQLLLGFAGLLLGAALVQFVLLGLLSLIIVPVALILLAAGVFRSRGAPFPTSRQGAGFVLLALGVVALLKSGFDGSSLAFQTALHGQRPSQPAPVSADWLAVVGLWPLAALLIGLGFWIWAPWPRQRCLGWGLIALAVGPATLLVFYLLLQIWPVTT